MDVEKWQTALKKALPKEKRLTFLVLLGVCGIALIAVSSMFGGGEKKEKTAGQSKISTEGNYEQTLERELVRIIRAITGEESPEVLVTLESGGRTIYAEDEKTGSQEESGRSSEEKETVHVILKGSDGAQQALAVTEIRPKVKGVVIVSSRAGDPLIREKLTEAVKTALHISSARVCVTDTG